jgi:drug/metabolite transporter (DMT)-like permease
LIIVKKSLLYLGLFLTVTFWGASFVATKVAIRALSPVTIIVLRFGVGLLLIWIVHMIRKGKRRFRFRLKSLPMFALLGFLGVTFHQWLQVTGLKTAKATVGSWIVATIPIFVAILGWTVLKERLGAKRVFGISLAFISALVVAGDGNPSKLLTGEKETIGDFLFLLSSMNWAVFTVLSRRILRNDECTDAGEGIRQSNSHQQPLVSMMVVMVFGWAFSLIWFVLDGSVSELFLLKGDVLWAILFLGIACSGLAYIFWYEALSVVDAAQAGVFLYLEPIVTAFLAWPILGERMSVGSIVAGIGILFGVWIVSRT